MEQKLAKLARQRSLAVILVGVMALSLRLILLPVLPIPDPAVDDEFSYLLAADTFAHGRLANPTHPMWVHFEALQIIHQPTYASKYPPAQGAILALGQVVAGHPFWGVWLSAGLMCAAICWGLQGWFEPEWALLGGFLAVTHLAVFSYWGNSYWGGAMAATGGALAFGALPRLKQAARTRDALLLGFGLIILANSRPYEGLLFSVPIVGALILWSVRAGQVPRAMVIRRVIAPLLGVLLLGALATGYYFWRVTGSPFRMPYQVFQNTYDPAPYFVWQSAKQLPRVPQQYDPGLGMQKQLAQFRSMQTVSGAFVQELVRGVLLWLFYVGPLLTLPLVILPVTSASGLPLKSFSPGTRFILLAASIALVGIAVEVQFFPHYAAPMTILILALLLLAMRNLRLWQFGKRPVRPFHARAIPVALAVRFCCVPLQGRCISR